VRRAAAAAAAPSTSHARRAVIACRLGGCFYVVSTGISESDDLFLVSRS
jgi:hypothetical protein